MPVVDSNVKQAAKVGKSHCGNLGALKNGAGPGATHGETSKLDENAVIDFECKGIGQMFAFLMVGKAFYPAGDGRVQ